MPDISKCANNTCPLRLRCYRYRVIPDPYHQAYADFKPQGKTCKNFWDVKGYNKKDLFPEHYVQFDPFKDEKCE